MTGRQESLVRRALNTLGSMALALALAMLVWAGATSADNPSITQPFRTGLSIQIRNQPPDTVIVSRQDTSVQVRLTAPQDTWSVLGSSDIEVYVDLSQVAIGEDVQVPVQVQIRRPGVFLVERTPATMTMRLEHLATRTVPARVTIIDAAPLGYVTRPAVITPSEVSVTGPAPAVERVAYAGLDVWLRGTTESIDRDLAPVAFDASGVAVGSVTMDPATVNLQIELAQRAGWEPNVPVRVNLVGEVSPEYSVANISVLPSRVTLLGLPEALGDIEGYINTEPIDITGATQSISQRVNLQLPSGVTVVPDTADATQTVQVNVEIEAITSGRTMTVPVVARGLAPGATALLSPESLDVVLSGPLALLANLSPESVDAGVNLVDLSAGTHRVTPAVAVPEGIELKGVLPETVEVQISIGDAADATAVPAR